MSETSDKEWNERNSKRKKGRKVKLKNTNQNTRKGEKNKQIKK